MEDLILEIENQTIQEEVLNLLGDYQANNHVFKSKQDWLRADHLLRSVGIDERRIERTIGDVHHNVFRTQVHFANRIFNEFEKGHRFVLAQAPMQFGKTGTQYYLANALLGSVSRKNVLFLTSMSDVSLYHQNKMSLSNVDYKGDMSRIKVAKLSQFKNDPEFYIDTLNIGYIFYDECDYGSGINSSMDEAFFQRIHDDFQDVKCMMISATPYDALYSIRLNQLEGVVVQTQPPKTYFGIRKMLTSGMVEDLEDFSFLTGGDFPTLTDRFAEYLEDFAMTEGGGLAMIRTTSRNEYNSASGIKDRVDFRFGDEIETMIIGVKHQNIAHTINEILPKKMQEGKKVLLIVINGLSAGKDLGVMKNDVRLVIETRSRQIANVCQGLVGRVCGYHGNRDIKIVAHQKSLEYYADLEADYMNIYDDDFINLITIEGLNVCGHLKKLKKGSDQEYNVGKVRTFVPMDNLDLIMDADIRAIVDGERKRDCGHIQSQRLSNYTAQSTINKFKEMVLDCKEKGFITMNQSHRYRAESKKGTADRIKVFVVIVDKDDYHEHGVYIIDVTDEKVKKRGSVTNKSSMYSTFLQNFYQNNLDKSE